VAAGQTREQNLSRLVRALSGRDTGPVADLLCLNAGACLALMDKVSDVREGVEQARQALREGRAVEQLRQVIRCQNENPAPGLSKLEELLSSS
jgi:anthranilate phosphoribosyltransferase